MSGYVKTNFINGQAPALSAEELNKIGDGIERAFSSIDEMLFGDGADGDVTITGTTYLYRDMFYNNLTINAGATLKSNGYKIFVKGTLTNNGTIDNSGGNGGVGENNAGVAGIGGGTGGTYSPYVWRDGGAGSLGGNGGDISYNAGDTSYSDPGACPLNSFTSSERSLISTLYGLHTYSKGGGGGGAAGSGSGTLFGNGGGGGGRIHIYADTIINNGTISAKGGNGGTALSNNTGGGGGGGGGFVLIAYRSSFTGNYPVISGGSAGLGLPAGSTYNGYAGGAGTYYIIQIG